MRDRQCSDKANAGRSGGVNNQTGTLNAQIHKADSTKAATNIPAKGTSNGGK